MHLHKNRTQDFGIREEGGGVGGGGGGSEGRLHKTLIEPIFSLAYCIAKMKALLEALKLMAPFDLKNRYFKIPKNGLTQYSMVLIKVSLEYFLSTVFSLMIFSWDILQWPCSSIAWKILQEMQLHNYFLTIWIIR